MSNDDYQDKLGTALETLRERRADSEQLSSFEHEVWSEIAIRDEQQRWRWLAWLRDRSTALPIPAAACMLVAAIVAGGFFGLSEANAYARESSMALEERYVQSIHSVMMSERHTEPPQG